MDMNKNDDEVSRNSSLNLNEFKNDNLSIYCDSYPN